MPALRRRLVRAAWRGPGDLTVHQVPAAPGWYLIAGLTCLTLGACCFIAFLISATRAALRRRNR